MSEHETDMNPYNPYGTFMTGPAAPEGTTARAGERLPDGAPAAAEEVVADALRTVHDPEIPVNIYDLGLIYEVERLDGGDVRVLMTLTAPACPVAGQMPLDVAAAVAEAEGVGEVEVILTWEPPWTPERMNDVAKLALNMF